MFEDCPLISLVTIQGTDIVIVESCYKVTGNCMSVLVFPVDSVEDTEDWQVLEKLEPILNN